MGHDVDVVVIGAGFGGLGAALSLAEAGLRVRLYEALRYPGGCAATFQRGGARFDAGATVSSGLGEDELFGRWLRRYGLPLTVSWPDPVMTLRAPGVEVPLWRDPRRVVDALAGTPGGDHASAARLMDEVAAVSGPLWSLLRAPELLPPWSAGALLPLAARAPALLPLLRHAGRPLGPRLDAWGVTGAARLVVDALCQITVQCPAAEADAGLALGAIGYPWQGAAHVHGGIGVLAEALLDAARTAGVDVRLADRVRGARWTPEGWRVAARSGEVLAGHVVANLLPADAAALAGLGDAGDALHAPVAAGWGAVTSYRVIRGDDLPREAFHLLLVGDPSLALVEGNQAFVSVSSADEGRAPDGARVLTASTHLALAASRADPAGAAARAQARLSATLTALAPELGRVDVEHTGSPRTFQRFTGRAEGAVGGPRRLAGLGGWLVTGPRRLAPGFWLVGDSHFPGQSTLAAALGGARAAEAVRRAVSAPWRGPWRR